jgi:hypothetical protein
MLAHACSIPYLLCSLIWAAVMVASQEETITRFYDQMTIFAAIPAVLTLPAFNTDFMPKRAF